MSKLIMRYYPFNDRTCWYYVDDNNKWKRISGLNAAYKIAEECVSENHIDECTMEFILK